MTFLDFYTFDLTQFVIIALVTLSSFMLFNYFEDNKTENYTFNLAKSVFIGVLISLTYSYNTIEPDNLLTDDYWS